jgi:uncharacterized repeat protein (TIGR04138 family)
LADIARADGRYAVEAFAFVGESLRHQVERVSGGDAANRRHLSAAELVEGAIDLAARRWGVLADLVLSRWGLRSGGDIGEVTFLLIGHGILSKQAEDRREDFDGLPELGPAVAARARLIIGSGGGGA